MNKKTCETPWSQLNAQGDGLTVDDFITTLMSQVGNALRRTITVPYAEKHDLTVSEWRLLALIAHARRLAFSDLVIQSTSDKALVSRALKRLQAKGLVDLQGEGNTPRKKIFAGSQNRARPCMHRLCPWRVPARLPPFGPCPKMSATPCTGP